MAASKKTAKGNKTAHVLNLLTAPGAPKDGVPADEETTAEAAGQAASAPSRPLLPPILEVAQSDDSLAQQIQRALEEELDEVPAAPAAEQPTQSVVEEVPPVAEEHPIVEPTPVTSAPAGGKMSQEEIERLLAAAAAPAEEPAPVEVPAPAPEPPAPAPAPSGGKMSQEEIERLLAAAASAEEPAPAEVPAPAPEPPAPAPQPAAEKPAPKPQPPEEEDVSYFNIMQTLVEEKASRYIQKFGLCSCKRCEADVKALTLTNLIPKYVVMSKLDRIPMLTVYESRYNSTIIAQLTRACKAVMDHPHHSRAEE